MVQASFISDTEGFALGKVTGPFLIKQDSWLRLLAPHNWRKFWNDDSWKNMV
jgi:hypothetical protein